MCSLLSFANPGNPLFVILRQRSRALASDSQRRISVLPADLEYTELIGADTIWADGDKKGGLALQCDKNDHRGILAGLEGVSGKKAVDSETMTVKN
jgi:hypothetical protein